jgi:hypothetical protein
MLGDGGMDACIACIDAISCTNVTTTILRLLYLDRSLGHPPCPNTSLLQTELDAQSRLRDKAHTYKEPHQRRFEMPRCFHACR